MVLSPRELDGSLPIVPSIRQGVSSQMRRPTGRPLFALTAMATVLSLQPPYVFGPTHPGRSDMTACDMEDRNAADEDALLSALEEGDQERALELLRGRDAAALLRRRSRRRDCTALMLAAGASGEIYEDVVESILAFGSSANVAAKSRSFRTAADYAEMQPGGAELASRLRDLAARELAATAHERCPCCGAELMQRPRVASLADRYRDGNHTNPLLQRFFRDWEGAWETLMRPEFHTFHKARSLHKELSESLAVLERLHEVCPEVQHAAGKNWHVIDLCCGKSLTCALAASRLPELAISAVDHAGPEGLPHYEWAGMTNVLYLQQDVLVQNSTESLSQRIARVGRPTAVIGIHLCGRLSERAIELFEAVEQVRTCILVPCCLPHLRQAPASLKHLYRKSVPDATQYVEWASYLQSRLVAVPGSYVETATATDMKSNKRIVLSAIKRNALAREVHSRQALHEQSLGPKTATHEFTRGLQATQGHSCGTLG